MKYLRLFENNKYDNIISDIESVCLELSDVGFYTGRNKGPIKVIKNQKPNLYVLFENDKLFGFEDVSDVVYRIKDIIGIQNILAVAYQTTLNGAYKQCDISSLEKETINIRWALHKLYISFNI